MPHACACIFLLLLAQTIKKTIYQVLFWHSFRDGGSDKDGGVHEQRDGSERAVFHSNRAVCVITGLLRN